MDINGLKVPEILVEAMEKAFWDQFTDISPHQKHPLFDVLFPLVDQIRIGLYSESEMAYITNSLIELPEETQRAFVGKKNSAFRPGTIDFEKMLVIGETGLDNLIALDYRRGDCGPDLIYLNWIRVDSYWFYADGSLAKFIEAIEVSYKDSLANSTKD